jgi:hypothetical protein
VRNPTALITVALLATACTRQNLKVDPPKIVQVEVTKFVPVPDELTEPCTVYSPAEQTYAEAKRLALLRLESLKDCNARMARIRALGEGAKP